MTRLTDLQALTQTDERLCQVATDPEAVRAAMAEAREVLAELGPHPDPSTAQRLYGYLAEAHRVLGESDAALEQCETALALSHKAGNARAIVANTIRLGEIHRCRGDLKAATALQRRALDLSNQPETEFYHDFALQHLGKALFNAGEYDEALDRLEAARERRVQLGSPSRIASTDEAITAVRARMEETSDT